MAPITTVSFTRDDRKYDVQVSLDDGALMGNNLVLEVAAKVTDAERKPFEEAVTLELDIEKQRGRILHGDEEWYAFSFGDINVLIDGQEGVEMPPEMEGSSLEKEPTDEVAEFVETSIGTRISDMLKIMPATDPIFGCALKAGISATLGQTLVCNELSGSDGTARQRTWRIARCLRDHVSGIFTRTLWRAARCMVTMGIY